MGTWSKAFVATLAVVLTAIVPSGRGGAATTAEPVVLRFHGGGYDRAGAMVADSAGNLYLAGDIDKAGSATTFAVTKLSPSGSVQWTAHYSGSRGGVGGTADAVALDAAGNVYVAGMIGDGVMFNTNWDYLVVKVGPDGVERWAQRYNGTGNNFDRATEVVVDAAGAVYVTGFSYGQDYDWATLKFTANGTPAWERRHTGAAAGDDRVMDMALAPNGDLVLTGFTMNTGDRQTGDAETLTYNPLGNVVWQQRWTATATSHEFPVDLDVDGAGRIAITGTTAANASPYAMPFPFAVRYDGSGNLLQTMRDVNAGGSAVDLDAGGNVYLAGSFFATEGASSVAKYSAAGSLVWTTPLTVGSDDAFRLVAVGADSTGTVTVAGTVSYVFSGDGDYLTIRYSPTGTEQWRYRFAGAVGGHDTVAALAVEGDGDALVTGTSWNDYLSSGGTADDIVSLRFAAGSAPGLLAPSNLTATAPSASQVRLGWQDNAGTEDGFRIERCTGLGCTNFTVLATVKHDATAYVDEGLSRLTTYRYRVQAFNAGGSSAYTNVATVKTKRR